MQAGRNRKKGRDRLCSELRQLGSQFWMENLESDDPLNWKTFG